MTVTYNFLLVGLSALIAMLASYTTLELVGWVTASRGFDRLLWLVMGATVMGIGIWSMHFIAMLAFSLPISIGYDFVLVIVSLLVAVLGCGQALFIISRPTVTMPTLLAGSTCMGIAIAAMHYIGMAAMQLPANIHYKPKLFALSVAIAIAVSLVALRVSFEFREKIGIESSVGKIVSAIFMGAAVLSMHYTGMAAAIFQPTYNKVADLQNYGNYSLGLLISLITLLLLTSSVYILKT
jgi:methyl-accepting chemotaxis protein PixJ